MTLEKVSSHLYVFPVKFWTLSGILLSMWPIYLRLVYWMLRLLRPLIPLCAAVSRWEDVSRPADGDFVHGNHTLHITDNDKSNMLL